MTINETTPGDTNVGEPADSDTSVKWPSAEDLASWDETPPSEGGDEPEAVAEETVEGADEEVQDVPAQKATRAPVPYNRFEHKVRQVDQLGSELAQERAKVQLLERQLQQVIAHVERQQGSQPTKAAEPAEEDVFVDPEVESLKRELAAIREWQQAQVVEASSAKMRQEYESATSRYPLAAKAPQLVIALLESDPEMTPTNAVIAVHNHLASVLPKKPATAPVAKPGAKAPPPKGAPTRGPVSATPQYKTLEEATAAFLRGTD